MGGEIKLMGDLADIGWLTAQIISIYFIINIFNIFSVIVAYMLYIVCIKSVNIHFSTFE